MQSAGDGLQPMRDLDQIRSFMSSAGPAALFDLPWMPLYVGVCFLFHPLIGIAALCGAVILVVLTLLAEFATRAPAKAAVGFAAARNALLDASRRNAEVLHAMGMGPQLSARFDAVNGDYLDSQRCGADRACVLSAVSRVTRLVLQSLVLGLGAYLVINHEATAGVIIASSILVSRALAPVELAIANWKGFVAARQARKRLNELLLMLPERKQPLPCRSRRGSLAVEAVSACPPGNPRVVLQDVSFALKAGDGLGIVGPSASGKSSLARLIVGVWLPVRGNVRLDGAALDQWSPDALGRHVGYLPQNVELFDGIDRRQYQPLRSRARSRGYYRCGARPLACTSSSRDYRKATRLRSARPEPIFRRVNGSAWRSLERFIAIPSLSFSTSQTPISTATAMKP